MEKQTGMETSLLKFWVALLILCSCLSLGASMAYNHREMEESSPDSSFAMNLDLPPWTCYLPPDSGSLSQLIAPASDTNEFRRYRNTTQTSGAKPLVRYFYSALNYNCEAFPYSGQGGNKNNFRSYEECMHECFNAYDIQNKLEFAHRSNSCYFGNFYYSVNDSLAPEDVHLENPCNICQCAKDSQKPEAVPRVRCIQPKCAAGVCGPKNFTCCDSARCCGQFLPEDCLQNEYRCKYDSDKEAYVDSNFTPREFPCFTCYCDETYPGYPSTEVCRERGCGIGLNKDDQLEQLKKGCIPEYNEGECCPVSWDCSSSSLSVSEEDDEVNELEKWS